ncbi:MAG: hypothetical protein HYX27_15670 [Acidobacteria bacterium]|nr:hypothetical protein [Acidobacteriota bacterium]
MQRPIVLLCLPALLFRMAAGQSFALETMDGLRTNKVAAEAAVHKGKKGIRVTEAAGVNNASEDRMLLLPVKDFENGTIEAEIGGEPGPGAAQGARGFVGIAFRVGDNATKFDAFYLRPTNGRADDQVRRNHSVQYVSHPDWPWMRLRKEEPEKYESYVDLLPGEWTRVRVEVDGAKARLFVHENAQPTLIVNDLKQGAWKGQVGLWIGPGTIGHFRNVKVTKK